MQIERENGASGPASPSPSAHLVLQVTGEPEPRIHALTGGRVRLGRAAESDVVLDLPWVSREQLFLVSSSRGWSLEPGPDATTPVLYQGVAVTHSIALHDVDYFRIPGSDPGQLVTGVIVTEPGGPPSSAAGEIAMAVGEIIGIGSDEGNMLGAGSGLLAGRHATVERGEDSWTVTDLSGGYTLLDGKAIEGATTVTSGRLSAGGFRIVLAGNVLQFRDASAPFVVGERRSREIPEDLIGRMEGEGGVAIEARHLQRSIRGGANLLADLSLRIRPRELVVLVGLSGAGKSTLLNALSGYRPATAGRVLIDGVDLYDNLDHFRSVIGYVPQKDIVHTQLKVAEALDYAARLRLPPSTAAERSERVDEVLQDLGLGARRDLQISRLSGGQLKRVSIGVELISRPELLFLDEPTSGLDPVTETGLMLLLRSLADQGRTVVVITHATKNVMLADRVIFMVPGGRIAWFGPPAEALRYFDEYRDARERADRPMEFDEIYRILEDQTLGTPDEWDRRYRDDPAYHRYIAEPLALEGQRDIDKGRGGDEKKKPGIRPVRPGPFRQLITLSARNVRLLARDRFALILMLAAAPLLAALDFLITERQMFDSLRGDSIRIVTNTNTMIVNAMLVGALAQMREISKDRDIYRRERLVNLGIAPYVLSKVWVAALLAFYQAIWWVGIRYLAVEMPGGMDVALGFYVTMVLVTFAGMMLGLFASAIAPSEDSVALIVALLIVPQVLFSGAHLPVHTMNPIVRQQMAIMPSRWAFEALITLGGHGKDVARDRCWQLNEAERAALSDEERAGCTCSGANLLETCNFPGIRAFAPAGVRDPAIEAEAVTRAEGRLAVDYNSYGPIYDVNLLSRWLALLGISGGLIVIILVIQRIKDRL
jgi:ABC-type multidrug transport system ATPase subunit